MYLHIHFYKYIGAIIFDMHFSGKNGIDTLVFPLPDTGWERTIFNKMSNAL